MQEKKKILECLINQRVSLVLRHGYRSDGIIASIGEEMILISALGEGENEEYFEYVEIAQISNILLGGKNVERVEEYQSTATSKAINDIWKF